MTNHVVAISGGKDSTAMALRLVELYPETNFEFVCTPTGDELPPMQAHWEMLGRKLGGIKRLNTMTLEQCIEREGMIPNFRARFCTRIIKIEPFIDYMNALPTGSIMYVGLRADEPDRMGLVGQGNKFIVRQPMKEWGWTIKDVADYLDCKGVTIPERTDCGACFYQRLDEWKSLLELYPDRYQQYVDIEKRAGHTFRSPGRDTWPADLDSLRQEFQAGRKLRQRSIKDDRGAMCPWCSK